MALFSWALPRLSNLLPLDEDSLKQIVDYSLSLPKDETAQHLKNLLGDSPQALEFITTFNSRRETTEPPSNPVNAQSSEISHVPRSHRKKKTPFNKLPPPRRPDNFGDTEGGYIKTDVNDYIPGPSASSKKHDDSVSGAFALSTKPDALQLPTVSTAVAGSSNSSRAASPKPPPSAAGMLISDLPNVKKSSRYTSGSVKAKIHVTGGTSMHGQSTTLNDLDSAIRTLEIQTNPSLSSADDPRRKCNCNATRHPLLTAAPNCLYCGKIICVKEGLGPCTFCKHPLLSSEEIQEMVTALKAERGRERMEANNASHRRADVSQTPRAFSANNSNAATPNGSDDESLARAKQHRDKLLNFQANNAKRTRIIDEAADFEIPSSGLNAWANPAERAAQLKHQQKVLRKMEWSAKPEYEKRRMVVSVDLVGGKVVKKMAKVEQSESSDEESVNDPIQTLSSNTGNGSGTFSNNPLLKGLIRPIWKGNGQGKVSVNEASPKGDKGSRERKTWRRVQDDNDDNEELILDGGLYGRQTESS
ncbi:MAG: hypothetical protein M1834_009308 [Cirrosporium novae-zelandiae]|nr:MAG: hypothetical protein M1834_009308 [Cirrosporium novae-zelandiae]